MAEAVQELFSRARKCTIGPCGDEKRLLITTCPQPTGPRFSHRETFRWVIEKKQWSIRE